MLPFQRSQTGLTPLAVSACTCGVSHCIQPRARTLLYYSSFFAFTQMYPQLSNKYDRIFLSMIERWYVARSTSAGRKPEGLWNSGQSQLRGWVGIHEAGSETTFPFGLCWFCQLSVKMFSVWISSL